MSTIIEAFVPAEQLALAETLTRYPDAEFRVVRLVAHGAGQAMPFLWADCEAPGRLRRAIEADRSVRSFDVLAEVGGACLLWVEWGPSVRTLASVLGDADASILDAGVRDGGWCLQIFFPDQALVSSACESCEEFGIDIAIERINCLSETPAYGYLGLTECQYETLVTAYELGYYDVPRGINQAELAANFDVSHQALSERLRRAHRTVITNALSHRIHRRDHAVSPRMRHEVEL